jgi:hypothetical protein
LKIFIAKLGIKIRAFAQDTDNKRLSNFFYGTTYCPKASFGSRENVFHYKTGHSRAIVTVLLSYKFKINSRVDINQGVSLKKIFIK